MSPEGWQKINEIFNDAADLSLANRSTFLDENCETDEIRQEVENLLKAEDSASKFLEKPAIDFTSKIPETIGKYRVISELGKGGMGSVYLAEREDLHQKVAVKIIKRGLDSKDILRRFKHETEILATLEHPNIARLIDGGTTDDGLPFYAMEFVEGVPIDEFCKDKSLEEKLDLFRQVCKAVAYAHARLVVHRDLKPQNILVDKDGTAKLLDFGIAKLVSTDTFAPKGTATSLGMMTPNYASPEQIRGEQVTTATDIYSLGVILYELLTGVLPYDLKDKTLDKVFEIISKTDIVKPSDAGTRRRGDAGISSQSSNFSDSISEDNQQISVSPFLRVSASELKGDLDNIVLKSLQKEPERRYQSVKDFSEDIRRYLNGLPISARPDTFRYRATKFIQRNKIAVAGASLVFLSLIGGIIGIGYQNSVANRQRALAEKRFADVRELANKVVFRYHDEIAKFPGATALREELVQDAVKYLDSLNAEEIDDNSLKLELARAYQKIGDVQGKPYTANLGKTEDALVSYQKSVDILEKATAKSPKEYELKRELVRSYLRLIALKARIGGFALEEWVNYIESSVKMQLEINEADRSNPDENALELADVYVTQADYGQSDIVKRIEIYTKAAELIEKIPNKTLEIQHNLTRVNQRLGTNHVWLGDEFAKNGDKEKALENYRKALPYNEKMFESVKAEITIGGSTQNLQRILAGANQNLGENYFKLGEKEKGFEMLNKNLEITLELAKADAKNTEAQIDIANSYQSFTDAYQQFGDYPKAIESIKKALEIIEKQRLIATKNAEISVGLVKENLQLINLLEKINRKAETNVYRQKNVELCKIDAVTPHCVELGLVK
jgi:eukaryotic-like serine/threonine-protein kinase